MFGVLLCIVLIFRVLLIIVLMLGVLLSILRMFRLVMIAPSTLILSLHVVGSNKIVLQRVGRGNHIETDHLEDLIIYEIILKRILKKCDRRKCGIYLATIGVV